MPYLCKFCKQEPEKKAVNVLVLKYKDLGYDSYKTLTQRLNIQESEKELTRNFTLWGLKSGPFIEDFLDTKTSVYVWIEALYAYLEQVEPYERTKISHYYYFYGKDNEYYHQVVYPQLLNRDESSPHGPKVTCIKRNFFTFNREKISSSGTCVLDLSTLELPGDLIRYGVSKLDPLNKDAEISQDFLKTNGLKYFKKYVNLGKRILGLGERDLKVCSKIFDLKAYLKYMDCNDLKNSLKEIDNYYDQLVKLLEETLKTKNIQSLDTLNFNYCVLLKLLYPFTPNYSKFLLDCFIHKKAYHFNSTTYQLKTLD